MYIYNDIIITEINWCFFNGVSHSLCRTSSILTTKSVSITNTPYHHYHHTLNHTHTLTPHTDKEREGRTHFKTETFVCRQGVFKHKRQSLKMSGDQNRLPSPTESLPLKGQDSEDSDTTGDGVTKTTGTTATVAVI